MTGIQVAGTAGGGVTMLILAIAGWVHARPRLQPRHADKTVIPIISNTPAPPPSGYGSEDTGSWLAAAAAEDAEARMAAARARVRAMYDELAPAALDAAADTMPPHPRPALGPGLRADVPLPAPAAETALEPLPPLPPLPQRRRAGRHAAPAPRQGLPAGDAVPAAAAEVPADRAGLREFVDAVIGGQPSESDGLVDLEALTTAQLGGRSVDEYIRDLFGGDGR